MMPLRVAASLLALLVPVPAYAVVEEDIQLRYCPRMITEYTLPDQTRIDCVSGTHAIEVEFSEKWAEAIGQSLHYALWSKEVDELPELRAGIILYCRKARDTCTDHFIRMFRVIEFFGLPITIWDCDRQDQTLDDCQRIEAP